MEKRSAGTILPAVFPATRLQVHGSAAIAARDGVGGARRVGGGRGRGRRAAVRLLAAGVLPLALVVARTSGAQSAIRINVNGPAHSGVDHPGSWHADPGEGGVCGPGEFGTTSPIQGTVDDALFQGDAWGDPAVCAVGGGGIAAGTYQVRLLFGEFYWGAGCPGGTPVPSPRLFDVVLEGALVETGIDLLAEGEGCVASADAPDAHPVMRSYVVDILDGTLDVELPASVDNGKISAIEILPLSGAGFLVPSPASVDFGPVPVRATSGLATITLTNAGAPGDPDLTVLGASLAGDFSTDFAGPVTLAPGASTGLDVVFAPDSVGTAGATLVVAHDGVSGEVRIPLVGEGFDPAAPPISFVKGRLLGAAPASPTSLQLGPDGRLYVSGQFGWIYAYTVQRFDAGDYRVVASETIDLVRQIPNHDDDGTPDSAVVERQVTGILVTGSAANPRIWVTSSDPRMGGAGGSGTDLGLDTNSSAVSRLDWTGAQWTRTEVVRGLPRSEQNHSVNGLALDPIGNTLYVAIGGFTNQGAPSNNFAFTPEYALSAAILSIDLDAIAAPPYDLPTLDDENRPGSPDANDPFGGNDGKNQALLVPDGPVQVHASGFRNPYDVVLTEDGRLYTVDNGPNAGWGDPPAGEGTPGCTNAVREPGSTFPDSLHFVSAAGYYGGHPNPTRANPANTFNPSQPQSPVPAPHPVECDYRTPGAENGALATWPFSTNGLVEYRAGEFGGALQGDLLATSFDDSIQRVTLDAEGDAALQVQPLFASAGPFPLDVTAQGDADPFPGTIWVAVYGGDAIDVYEPVPLFSCSGADDPLLDEDGDGYRNDDEIDTGTDPCSAADFPPDADGDLVSDRNDPDDDDDGVPDVSDPFAIDAEDGRTTALPVRYGWDAGAPAPGGLLGLGFTGLMTNGVDDYLDLFDPALVTAGGAAGVTTIDAVPAGDAANAGNDQRYGFQFGVVAGPGTPRFTVRTRIVAPFAGITPQGAQSMGLAVGAGDQDHYAKLVVTAAGGGGIEFGSELGGVLTTRPVAPVALPGPDHVDLILEVDPGAASVTPFYQLTTGGVPEPRQSLGGPEPVPPAWFDGTRGLALGILATSAGGVPFAATWAEIEAIPFPACSDGIDNDGDLAVDDPADPGCRHPGGQLENPQCQNGLDDDGSAGTDFDGGESVLGVGNGDPSGPDPDCVGRPWRTNERFVVCGAGFELAFLLPALLGLRGIRRPGRQGRASSSAEKP